MSSIGPLLILLLSGQVSMPANTALDPLDPYRIGWKIDREDQALCVIVQIHPDNASIMLQGNNSEAPFDLPPQLVGRASRVAVRVGTRQLPRELTLEQIERQFPRVGTASDVTSALNNQGPGRFTDLEAGRTVNNPDPSAPQLPLPGTSGLPATGSSVPNQSLLNDNIIDRARRASDSATVTIPNQDLSGQSQSLADRFMNGASGRGLPNTTGGVGTLPQTSSSNLSYPDPSATGGRQGQDAWRSNPNRVADGRLPAYEPPSLNNGQLGTSDLLGRGASTGATPSPGFGSIPGAQRDSEYRDPRSSNVATDQRGNYLSENYAGGPGANAADFYNRRSAASANGQGTGVDDSEPPAWFREWVAKSGTTNSPSVSPYDLAAWQQRQLMAQNPAGVVNPAAYPSLNTQPTDRVAANNQTANTNPTNNSASDATQAPPPKTQEDAQQQQSFSQAGNVFVRMFFLVSLVANCYLVFLIRKLLVRYRSLLSTVRNHAIT